MAATRAYRILALERAPAAAQVAATEALWQAIATGQAPATLRWYSYPSPALVLGIGQRAPGLLQPPAATLGVAGLPGLPAAAPASPAAGPVVPIAQRPSGGAAVYAAPELLALDLALPAEHPLAGGDVVEAYRWVGEAFAAALGSLAPAGRDRIVLVTIDQARADRRAQQEAAAGSAAALRGLACFGVLSPYEVALLPDPASARAAGTDHPLRKLVGLAQLRKRGVVLFQAGLYTRFPATPLAHLLAPAGGDSAPLATELHQRAADLAELGLERDVPAVIEAVTRCLAQRLEGRTG